MQTAAPPKLPEDEFLYQTGLSAFREATPEGYRRAAVAFEKASALRPPQCEYTLHLAESLLFLSLEEESNWQEFRPELSRATALMDALELADNCLSFESFIHRIRAISLFPELAPGRIEDALTLIQRSLVLDPADPMNHYVIAQLDPGQEGTRMLLAARQFPSLPLIQHAAANYLLSMNRNSEARPFFESALKLNPRHFRSLAGLAQTALRLDETTEVEPLYRRASEIAPDFLEAHGLLGDYYSDIGEIDLAVEQYKADVALNPGYTPAYLAIGGALLEADRYDEAIEPLQAFLSFEPRSSLAHYYLGNAWLGKGDLDNSKEEYRQALRINPYYSDAIYGMGNVLIRQDQVDGALTSYDEAIRLAPQTYPGAYFTRGEIRSERAQIKEAREDYDRAVEIYQSQSVSLEARAIAAESKGITKKAGAARRKKAQVESQLRALQEAREQFK